MKTALCLLGLAVLLSGAGPASEEKLLEVHVVRDLPYVAGEEVGDRRKLDLYLPKGDGPWPVLLWIHGGAWAVGHRKDEEALARRFAERGIAVAVADHRMSKALWMDAKLDEGVEHPVHVKDCATAFAWLVANAGERKLDPKRMYVGGFSSGAHLTALLATDPKYLKAHGLEPSNIRGALPVGGAYDMAAYYEAHPEVLPENEMDSIPPDDQVRTRRDLPGRLRWRRGAVASTTWSSAISSPPARRRRGIDPAPTRDPP